MRTLVIVESPSKCKTIEGYLGDKYRVVATCGHFRALTKLSQINLLTMDIKYSITKSKIIKMLKEEIQMTNDVIIATDNDREGEAIAWHICDACNLPLNTKRIIFHEITRDALQRAIIIPTTINMNKVTSQKYRQILDLYIGYTISPILWKYIQHKLSAGRCQTPALHMLWSQEQTILSQSYNTKYKIIGTFTNNIEFNSCPIDKELVLPFLELCKNYKFIVEKKDSKIVEYEPPSILITSTLQQRASQYLSMSPKQTMSNAQTLYENGFITYMRTDTPSYSDVFIDKINKHIIKNYGEEYVGCPSTDVKTHEGIRVTNLIITSLNDSFESGVNRLYEFIYKHTLQSCMSTSSSVLTNYDINCPMDIILRYVSSQTKFYGWKKMNKSDNLVNWSNYLNFVSSIQCIKISAFEQCSNIHLHYTEAQLINKLEKENIGRPSTYTSILESLEKYVVKGTIKNKELLLTHYMLDNSNIIINNENKIIEEKNKLMITELGSKVIEFSYKYFTIFDYDYTKKMELFLDSVEHNEQNINESLTLLKKTIKDITDYNNITINEPKPSYNSLYCGLYKKNPIIIKDGPHGFYIEYKKECISLSSLSQSNEDIYSWIVNQDISEEELKLLINYIENKNVNIVHQINNNTTIRKSSNGYYIFYKTSKMKKPKFYSFPNELIDDIDKIKEYIQKKYKSIC